VNNNPRFYYAAEPFVNQLKNTNDPRSRFIIAAFANPNSPLSDPNPDVTPANQFGVPVGILSTAIEAGAPYRGVRSGGLNYSQINVKSLGSLTAPTFFLTYAQTSLLLAEAAKKGWIPGGDATAKTYYENGITADMVAYTFYPGTTPIPASEITAYINGAAVLYNPTDALKLINTQYWIVNLRNGTEAFANFRRTGFPLLTANPIGTPLPGGGFARRVPYPTVERSVNAANYNAAVTSMGGDDVTKRVFWDIP
jgi:hypothetical protein